MRSILTSTLLLIFLLNFSAGKLFSQCTGNTIFKEDFGGTAGSPTVGSPLPPGVTTYGFDGTGALDDGEYSIRTTTADLTTGGSAYGTWLIGGDHTGNGYMMIVNASYEPGKFYEKQINNLCPGSKLSFSAYIANLLTLGMPDPLDPNVKFEVRSAVSGMVLGTYTTGLIKRYSTLTWEKYGFTFTLPSGENSVILTMYNNQGGGRGNDLALDDIEFNLCGPANTVGINGSYLNGNTTCVLSNITLYATVESGYYVSPVYQWQSSTDSLNWTDIPGATQLGYNIPSVAYADAKWYRLLIAENGSIGLTNCRTVSQTLHLFVFGPQLAAVQNKNPFCAGDTLRATCTTSALQYIWSGPNAATGFTPTLTIPHITQAGQGTYTVNIITYGGCQSSASTWINILPNNLKTPLDSAVLICNQQTVSYDATDPSITSYLWSTGATTPTLTITTGGIYWLQVNDALCTLRDSVIVTQKTTPVVKMGNDTAICINETLLLDVTDPQVDTYLWQDGSILPTYPVKDSGTYAVKVTNGCGQDTASINVTFFECGDHMYVPNTFTPNNDKLNDILKAKAFFKIDGFEFRIYNIYGQMIFRTNDVMKGWDGRMNGKDAPMDTYAWTLHYIRHGIPFAQKGTTSLIR